MSAIDNPLAVGRPERATIIAEDMGEPLCVATVCVHDVEVQIAIARRGEDDLLAVAGERRLGVVAGRRRQLLQNLATVCGIEDAEGRINAPHVALRVVWARRAVGAGEMRRRVKDVLAVRIKVTAGGPALAG